MKRAAFKALRFVFWAAAGASCFLSFAPLERYYQDYYAAREPHYAIPTTVRNGSVRLRGDSYGKGHYGASRNGGRTHQGIDLISPVGAPVRASKTGRVSVAGEGKGYGLYVEILHPDGLLTRYAHLSTLFVRAGDWVEIGRLIGNSGRSGNADDPRIKPHVHFEIKKGATALDPGKGLLDPAVHIR